MIATVTAQFDNWKNMKVKVKPLPAFAEKDTKLIVGEATFITDNNGDVSLTLIAGIAYTVMVIGDGEILYCTNTIVLPDGNSVIGDVIEHK